MDCKHDQHSGPIFERCSRKLGLARRRLRFRSLVRTRRRDLRRLRGELLGGRIPALARVGVQAGGGEDDESTTLDMYGAVNEWR